MITTIKQYGEIRTGTNYLRALIQRNFPDIQVLSYILGSKHKPPVDFAAIWADAQQSGTDAAFRFVSTATYNRRGGASHPKDPDQRAELARLAPRVAHDYATGSLGFLITIKNPYAWVVSAARFNGWLQGDEPLQEWSLELMREACLIYNRNYRDWFGFVRSHPHAAKLIRYEDLLVDPEQILMAIANQFGWLMPDSFANIPAIVEPTQWDHLPVVEAEKTFCPEFYASGAYLQLLPAKQLQMINELFDWNLLQELGYTRL